MMCEYCGEKEAKKTVTNKRTKQTLHLCYQCENGFNVARYSFKEKLAAVLKKQGE